jgi:hypothetical protein
MLYRSAHMSAASRNYAAIMSILFLGISCAHAPSAVVVTGDVLDVAGVAFEATAAGMRSASDAHALSVAQVEAWNDFLARWKAGYPGAAALWREAVRTKDDALAAQAGAVVTTLMGQLAVWQTVVKGVAP